MPNTFLPPIIRAVNQYLFRYHMSFVLRFCIKQGVIWQGFLFQMWIVFYVFLAQYVWKKGTRAYMAFGQ